MGIVMGCAQSLKRKAYLQKHSYIIGTMIPCRPSRPELLEEHKHIVKETWEIVKRDIAQVGVVMFMSLFEKYPDVKQLFVHFRELPTERLRYNYRLRNHGLRVMNTIDKCVARLDKPRQLEKVLHELGRAHMAYNINVDFLDLIVPQLQNAIIPVLAEKWTSRVETAWSSFLRYVIHVMAEAMVLI